MRQTASAVGTLGLLLAVSSVTGAHAQTPPAASARTDVYHVHFTKAAPGQADALGKFLVQPDQSAPMPTHFVVLRHQEGDDWDYCVIQHLGKQATVGAAPTPPNPGTAMRAWHSDTFVSGPAWDEFTRAMGIGTGAGQSATAVYIVGTHRAVAGQRDQLEANLSQPAPAGGKVQTGNVLLQHLEGGNFNFLTVTRYNSWQDLAADRAAASGAATGWNDIRKYSAEHHDTIADRLYPR
jgi:hypothetical protein